jgi:DNA-binding LacI/PurR family transcriptional regulator
MSVTMRDVADRAGVSVKTVSNVVNGFVHIRPETRERVESAIAELGYRVNVAGRNLRRGRTGMIGLAIPEMRNPYFAELADSFMRAAEARDLVLLIEHTGPSGEHELDALSSGRRQLTDGLLFSPMTMDPSDLSPFQDLDYPLVMLGERVFGAPVDHVTMNNREGARAATLHLAERGCRRIAVIGVHPGERMGSAALRYEGYLAGLADAGLPHDPRLVGEAGRWRRSTGAAAMARVLDSGTEVDGVFAMNDALALGALHELHERGIPVPREVAVVGFDDIEEGRYSAPTLSSISPGREQIARVAVDLLIERMAGESRPPRLVVADFELVARESTAR